MKLFSLTLILFGLSSISKAQNASVEKSTYGIQIGFIGIWAHNEVKLLNTLVLRSELGFESESFGGGYYPEKGFFMSPVLTLEPKWYYNLNKRSAKSRRISGNSGNFISLKSSYNPNLFPIYSYQYRSVVNQISFIPTWGIRRNLGEHFIYETGLGLGYRHVFRNSRRLVENENEVLFDLHLRIGYQF